MRALGAAVVALLGALAPAPPAQAAPAPAERMVIEWRVADADDFRPGLLISDDTFYSADAMDAADIQRFLEARACVPEDGVPCLGEFTATTPDRPDAGAGHCAAYDGGV